MPTHTAIGKPRFGSLEHLHRPSIMERVAERQGRHLRLRARQVGEKIQGALPRAREIVPHIGEAMGVGGLFGYLHGRAPEKLMIGPVPVELGVGVAAHMIGLFVSEEVAPHAHTVGLASLTSFAHALGRGFGRKHRQAAGLPPATGMLSGEEAESTGGGALSDEELARLARRA